MKKTYKKISTIVDELITFFYQLEATNMQINIDETKTSHLITISSNFNTEYIHTVSRLKKNLNLGRNRETEEHYWSLMGKADISDDCELHIISSMIDEADVIINDDHITIKLTRLRDEYSK